MKRPKACNSREAKEPTRRAKCGRRPPTKIALVDGFLVQPLPKR